MSKLLNALSLSTMSKLQEVIETQPFLSWSTDLWSSKNNKKSFLSLVVHFVDEDFHRQFAVVSTEPMLGEHRGEDIARAIELGIESVGVTSNRVHLVVRDAASSMRRAMRLLRFDSWDCFLHKLNLVGNE
jgi:hypothetical protein